METSETFLDSAAIKALGSLFKLTEVFLRDDGCSTDNQQVSSYPKHIRFVYDDDDGVDNEDVKANFEGKISLNTSVETSESVVMENADLLQEMNALGLPLSFQTSKNSNAPPKERRKHKDQDNPSKLKDLVLVTPELSEESQSYAKCQDKSINSLDQAELSCSGSDITDDNVKISSSCSEEKPVYMVDEMENDDIEKHECGKLPKIFLNEALIDDVLGTTLNLLEKSTSCERHLPDNCDEEPQQELDTHLIEHNDSELDNAMQMDDTKTQISGMLMDYGTVLDNENVSLSAICGEWSAFWDSFYMRYYFYNSKTLESTWHPPPGLESFAYSDVSNVLDNTKTEVSVDLSSSHHEEQLDRNETEQIENRDKHFNDDFLAQVSNASSLSSVIDCEYIKELETLTNVCGQGASRAPKPKKKRKNRRRKKSNNKNDDFEFQQVDDYYVDITKYWCQRYFLFSKFDDGIKMDEEGWFSVTPEVIAKHHASRSGSGVVIDCFAGVGGNVIQFAKAKNEHVIAIDIDPKKIDYAHHNATIYGVEDRIDFINEDCFSLAPKLKGDTVFLSPPWGGPNYLKMKSYDLSMLQPHNGQFLFNTFKVTASLIIMFLPRNVDIVQLAELCLSSDTPLSLEVEKNYLNGKLKAVTAYFSKLN